MSNNKQKGFEEFFMEKPESIEKLIDEMTLAVYESLRLAVEIGKWGDGSRLQPQQIEFCMQAIILYEAKHLPEIDRIGFDLSANCKSRSAQDSPQLVSFVVDESSQESPGEQAESEKGSAA